MFYTVFALWLAMFEFDPDKSAANAAKHGIGFIEAQALWKDERAIVLEVRHDDLTEPRWLVVGRIGDHIWTMVVTYRGETTRIISVRRARSSEASSYG